MARFDVIVDTSFLYALYNDHDPDHELCGITAEIYPNVLIPDVVLTETAYLFRRFGGARAVALFLKSLSERKPPLARVTYSDIRRASEVMDEYRAGGTQLDFVDCAIVAIAERYKATQVCTLDHRDFQIIRSTHKGYLDILPVP